MMNATLTLARPRKIRTGPPEQRLRRRLRITRWQLAELAGIPVEDVQDLEEGLPVVLESRRRIRQVLWAIKYGKRRCRATSRRLFP
jgi:hypothetical protein